MKVQARMRCERSLFFGLKEWVKVVKRDRLRTIWPAKMVKKIRYRF